MINKLNQDIKSAMISKDEIKKECLRSVKNTAQLMAKEAKCEVNDEIVLKSLKKELKLLSQTKESLINNQEVPLYSITISKIEIISEYLPKELSEDELKKMITDILIPLGDVPFGIKMKTVMQKLNGKADGKLIKQIIEKL